MRTTIAALVAATLIAGAAYAQAPSSMIPAKPAAATAPAAAPVAKPAKPPVVRTAKSLDCSKQADANGLHGMPRKSFMSSCKKA